MRVRFRPGVTCALALTVLLCGSVIAQVSSTSSPVADQTTLVPPVRPFRIQPRVGVGAETLITLPQVFAMALASNKDIEASRIDRQIAGYNVVAALGVFDPRVGADSYWRSNEQPTASVIGGSATGAILTKTWQSDPSVNGFVPWAEGRTKWISPPRT